MDDLIKRTEVIKTVHEFFAEKIDEAYGDRDEVAAGEIDFILKYNKELNGKIEKLQTVEARPVVHGEWIKESMGMRKNINTGEWIEAFYCTCPICGYQTGNQGTRFNFCPECGADMRKKVQE